MPGGATELAELRTERSVDGDDTPTTEPVDDDIVTMEIVVTVELALDSVPPVPADSRVVLGSPQAEQAAVNAISDKADTNLCRTADAPLDDA